MTLVRATAAEHASQSARARLTAHPALAVQTGVYLLALRHPATVARQLATIALLAPGRFTFGVGLGGDDPHELELCGVEPRTRGARMNETLICVRRVSPRRFVAATELIRTTAEQAGRADHGWLHTLQLWAGFDATRERAAKRVGRVMERSYSLPFERFERYTPCGRPEDVAAALEPYVRSGCRRFNFVPEAPDLDHSLAAIAEVRELLS